MPPDVAGRAPLVVAGGAGHGAAHRRGRGRRRGGGVRLDQDHQRADRDRDGAGGLPHRALAAAPGCQRPDPRVHLAGRPLPCRQEPAHSRCAIRPPHDRRRVERRARLHDAARLSARPLSVSLPAQFGRADPQHHPVRERGVQRAGRGVCGVVGGAGRRRHRRRAAGGGAGHHADRHRRPGGGGRPAAALDAKPRPAHRQREPRAQPGAAADAATRSRCDQGDQGARPRGVLLPHLCREAARAAGDRLRRRDAGGAPAGGHRDRLRLRCAAGHRPAHRQRTRGGERPAAARVVRLRGLSRHPDGQSPHLASERAAHQRGAGARAL